jgi:hypothetical protein
MNNEKEFKGLVGINAELEKLNENLKELIEIQKMTLFFFLKKDGHGLDLKTLQSLLKE